MNRVYRIIIIAIIALAITFAPENQNLMETALIAVAVIAAVLFLLVLRRVSSNKHSASSISLSEVKTMLENRGNISVVAIDEEPDTARLAPFENTIIKIAKDEIPIRLHQLEPLRGNLITILSANREDAEEAVEQLNQLGFPQVRSGQ